MSKINFNWIKRGKIFEPQKEFYWSQSHATLPTPFLLEDKILRIYYTSRDIEQKSRISYIDVNAENPTEVLNINKYPILELGEIGTLDDVGMTSSSVIKINGKYYLYYNGYNIGVPARYRIAIGLATTSKLSDNFKRISSGPIMDRSITDPCGCATPFIIFENGVYRMWYASFVRWKYLDGEVEPFYRIAYAESKDGISWTPTGDVCIDLVDDEGGIVRPTIIKLDHVYYMWFSVRKSTNYRKSVNSSYRIGFATSLDGIKWERNDNNSGITISENGWDSEMVAYPSVIRYNNKLYMFYNGNGFGQSGLGYAEVSF